MPQLITPLPDGAAGDGAWEVPPAVVLCPTCRRRRTDVFFNTPPLQKCHAPCPPPPRPRGSGGGTVAAPLPALQGYNPCPPPLRRIAKPAPLSPRPWGQGGAHSAPAPAECLDSAAGAIIPPAVRPASTGALQREEAEICLLIDCHRAAWLELQAAGFSSHLLIPAPVNQPADWTGRGAPRKGWGIPTPEHARLPFLLK